MSSDQLGWLIQMGYGATVTLLLGLSSMTLGLMLGLTGAIAKLSHSRLARVIARIYTEGVRGTPELLTILIVYFGLQFLINSIWGLAGAHPPNLHPFLGGTIALGIVVGAYATEVFRGAILSIPHSQFEAALALGLRPLLVLHKIILPQAWRIALPGLGNIWLVLLKETAIVSVITVEELLRTTQLIVNVTKKPFYYFFAACLMYLVLTSVSTIIQKSLERRAARGFVQD